DLAAAGYHAVHHSAGRWAGVAIVARQELELTEPVSGLPGELRTDEARWIEATAGGMRIVSTYVPNGRAVDTPTFTEKLTFLDAAAQRAALLGAGEQPVIIGGDLNVTRTDLDVYEPAAFIGSTHVTADERGRLEAMLEAGDLVDAYRHLHPDDQQFTWWDYRQGAFHRGLGLRIDYLLASSSIASGLEECGIARDFRKGRKPSDHAPLLCVLR
ncbi:MAG: exodeoxyribonuclease III, partial [Solirubrobacteraceae bacterium]